MRVVSKSDLEDKIEDSIENKTEDKNDPIAIRVDSIVGNPEDSHVDKTENNVTISEDNASDGDSTSPAVLEDLAVLNRYLVLNHSAVYLTTLPHSPYSSSDKNSSRSAAIAFLADALSLNYAVRSSSRQDSKTNAVAQATIDKLSTVDQSELATLLDVLKDSRGASASNEGSYVPMYPDFPKQVAEASDEELIVNAFLHYFGDWIGARIMPDYTPSPRVHLIDGLKPSVLTIIGLNDVLDVLKTVVSSSQVWSDDQRRFVSAAIRLFTPGAVIGTLTSVLPLSIHENAVMLYATLRAADGSDKDARLPGVEWHGNACNEYAAALLTSVTDVLRLAAYWSTDGDASLSERVRFKLTRPQRRIIIAELGKIIADKRAREYSSSDGPMDYEASTAQLADEFHRHEEEWKRLATTLHYRELASNVFDIKLFRDAEAWLSRVQQGDVQSLDGRTDDYLRALLSDDILEDDYDDAMTSLVAILASRPGVYARRLVELLRKLPADRHETIINGFDGVVDSVSSRVLIQLWGLLNTRVSGYVDKLPKRVVIMRTAHGQRTDAIDNTIADDVTVDEAARIMSIIEAALKRRRTGIKTLIDHEGVAPGEYIVPMGVGSASAGVKLLGRGSTIAIPGWSGDGADVARLFVHWRDIPTDVDDYYNPGRVDLDLSAVLFNDDFSKVSQVSYTNLRNGSGAVHSGDITSAPNGAAEYIDVHAGSIIAAGYRYVVPSVYSFTRQPFSAIPEAWAGIMRKTEVGQQTGEVFDPRVVSSKWGLARDARNSTPFILDLMTGDIIWVDMDAGSDISLNRVDGNEGLFATIARSVIYSRPMTVDKALSLLTIPVRPVTPVNENNELNDADKWFIEDNDSRKMHPLSEVTIVRPDDADKILSIIG